MKSHKEANENPTQVDEQAELPEIYDVLVTDEVRQLAIELDTKFAKIYSPGNASRRKAGLVFLKLARIHQDHARVEFSSLGQLKNLVFPSSFEDRHHRCEVRTRLRGLGQVESINQSENKETVISELPKQVETPSEAKTEQELGVDPLEESIIITRRHHPLSELVIYLDQYLPSDASEMICNLARTQLKFCPIPTKSLIFLVNYKWCFESIPTVLTTFDIGDNEICSTISSAHIQLLRLIKIIDSAVMASSVTSKTTSIIPHNVTILEDATSLSFDLDGHKLILTKSQKDTLIVLALLQDRAEFSTEEFVKLTYSSTKNCDQTFLNRINSLQELLPSLDYNSRRGVRIMQGLHFVKVPSKECMLKFLEGNFEVDL